jgi:FHA domain
MRFEVSYRTGTAHEVELSGQMVVIGRDPACDLVLNDAKCSRRHAVVEEGPEGLSVRDFGSANGIFVNGTKLERSPLKAGDTIRIGDVRITVLADIGETVVVGPEDLEAATAPDLPRPQLPQSPPRQAPERARRAAPRAPSRAPRVGPPLTVNVLALLWGLAVPLSALIPFLAARRAGAGALGWTLAAGAALVLAAAETTLALGLRALAPWARHLQIAAAALGLVVCPFTLASATVLFYMVRPEVKAAFDGGARADGASGPTEATFALSIAGMLALGVALTAGAVLLLLARR